MASRSTIGAVYYNIPYRSDKNLGRAYNEFMEVLPKDTDYACFVDADAIFTTPNYGTTIEQVLQRYSSIRCFTALTNRVSCKWQVHSGVDPQNNDMEYHRTFGKGLQEVYGTKCEDVSDKPATEAMSGLLILIRKDLWKRIGKFKESGMLGIDNDLHWKIQKNKEKIYLMRGIYLYHWYRYPNFRDTSHLV